MIGKLYTCTLKKETFWSMQIEATCDAKVLYAHNNIPVLFINIYLHMFHLYQEQDISLKINKREKMNRTFSIQYILQHV